MRHILAASVVLGLVVIVGPGVLRADDIVSIDISNLTIVGNPACGPSGTGFGTGTSNCLDTLNASWLYDSTTNAIVPGSLSSMSTGDVALPFSQTNTGPITSGIQTSFFFGSPGGTLDVFFEYNTELLPGNVTLFGAGLSSCFAICEDEFNIGQSVNDPAAITLTSVPTPEPSSLLLLGTGLIGLGLIARLRVWVV